MNCLKFDQPIRYMPAFMYYKSFTKYMNICFPFLCMLVFLSVKSDATLLLGSKYKDPIMRYYFILFSYLPRPFSPPPLFSPLSSQSPLAPV